MIFWNVAGVTRKDEEFWEFVKDYDYISLVETWLERKGWEKFKGWLPDTHEWEMVEARKEKNKGRARGGMLIGKRKGWGNVGKSDWWKGEERLTMSGINEKKEKWVIVSVYNSWEWKELEKRLSGWLEEIEDREDCLVVIGGDFNIRTGELGSIVEAGIARRSKDKTVGNGGRNLIDWVQNKGWYVLNGTCRGDWEGEYTYVGARGSTVIDYVIVNEKAHNIILDFKIEDRMDSDHVPLCLNMKKKEETTETGERQEEDGAERRKYIERIVWDDEAIKRFKERTENLVQPDAGKERSIEETWNWIKKVAYEAMVRRKIKIRRRKVGYKDWWDVECTRKKRSVHREFKLWKRGKASLEKLIKVKKKYREFLVEKQKEKREKEEKELEGIKKEVEVWKFLNKRRGKRRFIGNNIKSYEWKGHFKNLLGGADKENQAGEVRSKQRGKTEVETEELEELEVIQTEEIREVVKRMKKNKAAGCDGLPMEVWKYAGKDLWEGLVKLMKQVWMEERIPEDWRKSVIVPIYKRGDPNVPSNYRGISLLCSAYKIYAELIRKKLEHQVESLGCLPESQAGFRKGKSTMDNIFILSHLAQREREAEGREKRLYAFFADLSAAFDNVDRDTLWTVLRGMNLEEGLIRRMERIYENTEMMVKLEKECSESFLSSRGVRQGCVLSPILFNLYMAGVNEELRTRKIGGVEVGNLRIWELAYADDIVLLARNRDALEDMMRTLEKFLKKRKLELNVEKSKIMVFNRKKRERNEVWKWKGKNIEEVQNFKYLGFILNKEGNYREHLKELTRKGRLAVRKVWGLGEKVCRNDFLRRWNLFKYLVQSVISYGVEIWGWVEREDLEKIMLDYVRWLFRIDFCTPRYIIYREIGLEKLRIGWSIRARRFEERCKTRGGIFIKECWKEKENRGWVELYGRERERFYARWGETEGERENDRTTRDMESREIIYMERERERDRTEGKNRIDKARYNSRYRGLQVEGRIPRYLEKEKLEKIEMGEGIRALIKLRCGNLEEWNKYWLVETKRVCCFCGRGKDNMEHFIRECEAVSEWFREVGETREEIWKRIWSEDLDEKKGEILVRIWKSKERRKREARRVGEREEGEGI